MHLLLLHLLQHGKVADVQHCNCMQLAGPCLSLLWHGLSHTLGCIDLAAEASHHMQQGLAMQPDVVAALVASHSSRNSLGLRLRAP